MKAAILIPTYERADYLHKCLQSLLGSTASEDQGVQFVFIDDASVNPKIMTLLGHFRIYCCGWVKIFDKSVNQGVHVNLRLGLDYIFNELKAPVAVILDPDTLVTRNWLDRLLELHKYYPDEIISGFNTLSRDPIGGIRHPIISEHDGYVRKATIGGINMLFNEKIYRKYIRPNLGVDWDWRVCSWMRMENKTFVVTRPSVVQHIGLERGMHITNNPDIAEDFPDEGLS